MTGTVESQMPRRSTRSHGFYRLVLTFLLLLEVNKAICRRSGETFQGAPTTDENHADDDEISTLDEVNLASIPAPPPSSLEAETLADATHSENWYEEVFDVDEEHHKQMLKAVAQAISEDNVIYFKSFLEKGVDWNASYVHPGSDHDGEAVKCTLLHWTALYSAPKCAHALIDVGVYLNAEDKHRRTPLHYAAIHGSVSVAKVLIENGAEVDAVDIRNQTPLHKACRNGEPAIVKLLLHNDADVNAADSARRTPLHSAAYHQHKEIIELLLERGALKEAEDMYGNRPIDLACAADGGSYYYTDFSAYYDFNCIYSTPSEIEELLSP